MYASETERTKRAAHSHKATDGERDALRPFLSFPRLSYLNSAQARTLPGERRVTGVD